MSINKQIEEARELADYMDERNKQRMKEIDYAFMLPRPERWRKIIQLYLNEVPGLKEAIAGNIQMAKQQREEAGIWNTKVTTKGDSMRLGLVMPPAVLTIIETADPEFKEIMADNNDRAGQAKMFKLLCKAFPQFVVPSDLK